MDCLSLRTPTHLRTYAPTMDCLSLRTTVFADSPVLPEFAVLTEGRESEDDWGWAFSSLMDRRARDRSPEKHAAYLGSDRALRWLTS